MILAGVSMCFGLRLERRGHTEKPAQNKLFFSLASTLKQLQLLPIFSEHMALQISATGTSLPDSKFAVMVQGLPTSILQTKLSGRYGREEPEIA